MIGQIISHYTILEKLGEGGMGVVYKAQDTTLDRVVALKFLPPHLAASAQDKARFFQEAKAASALNHPNVCTIHAIEEHEGQLFIAMEFVDGKTLREKKGTVNFKQAIDIGIQIADGLAAAHEKGIVHRDIKPENIMIRKDGIAQIMDFGLAKLRASGSQITRLTKEGSTVGTAGYMSPEQVQGQETDHRSDIFSYGVLLYELLAGELPFKGVHETALAYEIVNVDPAPMSSVKPEIDPNLDVIVLECLEKDPRERTQSIAQTSLDLKRYRRDSSRQKMSRITAARPVQQPIHSQQDANSTIAESIHGNRPVRSVGMKWLPWGIALLCLLGFAGLSFIHFREALPEVPSINASITPPPRYSFNNSIGGHMALSPDGSMLAFVAADSAGNTSLWVRQLNSSSASQLAETNGAQFPFWSPDNRFIGFFTSGKLKKVLASGAPPITICDAPNGRGGTWNQEGVILFAPNFDRVSIYRVSASGGASAAVTHLDSARNETNHRWPHFLPDGKHFVYTTQGAQRTGEYTGAMYVANLDGSMNKLLIKASSNMAYYSGYLLYIRQTSVVAQPFDLGKMELFGDATPVIDKVEFSGDKSRGVFSISNNGILTYQGPGNNAGLLSLYDHTGNRVGDLGGLTISNGARFSPDGTKVALDAPDPESGFSDIWQYDILRKISTRVTFEPSSEWNPIWSPDGKKLVYSSDKRGSGDLFMKNADGTDAEELLLKTTFSNSPMDWSSDGKYIIDQTISESTGVDLSVLPLDGKRVPVSFANTKFTETNARISPEGHWLAYESDESGKSEVYVRPFPSGAGKWQVSNNGGSYPIWSGDGRQIFYNQSGGILMAVDVKMAGTAFSSGTPKMLFEIPRAGILDVSKDGKLYLAGAVTGALAYQPITLVTNWDKDLKKK
jgi:serine/threonine protein kinase